MSGKKQGKSKGTARSKNVPNQPPNGRFIPPQNPPMLAQAPWVPITLFIKLEASKLFGPQSITANIRAQFDPNGTFVIEDNTCEFILESLMLYAVDHNLVGITIYNFQSHKFSSGNYPGGNFDIVCSLFDVGTSMSPARVGYRFPESLRSPFYYNKYVTDLVSIPLFNVETKGVAYLYLKVKFRPSGKKGYDPLWTVVHPTEPDTDDRDGFLSV